MKKRLILIMILTFLIGLIHNLGHPVTPTYVNELGLPKSMFGYFFSTMAFGLFIGAILFGYLGDVYGKRKFILLGLFGYSIGQFLFGVFTHPILLIVARFISGFFVVAAGTLIPAIISDQTTKEKRTEYLSFNVAVGTLGAVLGYKLGGYLGTYIIKEVFYLQAGLNLLLIVFAYFILEKDHSTTNTFSFKSIPLFEGFKQIKYLEKNTLIFLFMIMFVSIAHTNISKYIDVWVIDLGYSTNDLGTITFITGIVGIITNFMFVPFVSKLNKDLSVIKITLVVSAITIFFTFHSNNAYKALTGIFLVYMVAKSTYTPLEQSFISKTNEHQHGTIMGIRQAFLALGSVIGPIIGGYLYEFNPMSVFYVNVGLFILSFFLLMTLKKQTKTTYE